MHCGQVQTIIISVSVMASRILWPSLSHHKGHIKCQSLLSVLLSAVDDVCAKNKECYKIKQLN